MATKKEMFLEDDRWKMKGSYHKQIDPLPSICPYCDGWGHILVDVKGNEIYDECPACGGTGEVYD